MTEANYAAAAVVFSSIAVGSTLFFLRLYPRVAGTELLVPLTVLFGSLSLAMVANLASSLAVLQGDLALAGQFQRAMLSISAFELPAFVHLVTRFPRHVSSPWANRIVAVMYGSAAARLLLAPTDLGLIASATAQGDPLIRFGPWWAPINQAESVVILAAMAWLLRLGFKGSSAAERNSARGLLLATAVPAFAVVPFLATGWRILPPFDPFTLGAIWWIAAVFVVVSSGRLQFRVPPTLDAVLNSVYDAILVVDRERRVFYANRACDRLLGSNSRQTLALPVDDVLRSAVRGAQGPTRIAQGLDLVLAGAKESQTVELVGVGPGGRACRVDIVPLGEGSAGTLPSAALIVFADETERVALEESNGRVRQLQDLVIRVLGHDLKAPIAVVQGTVELTEMRLAHSPPEEELVEIRNGLRRIREATVGMLVVLENARAVSRLTTENVGEVKLEEKDLSRMASATVALLQSVAAARRLTMEASIAPDVRARVLPGFESVVQNLLDNAIKYTPPGGAVGVRLFTDGAHVGIEVWDTGPGIPAAKRDKMFGKFERLGAEGGLAQGHGLGLSIVSKMVELSGGTVAVGDKGDDSPGAVFTVELPAAPTGAAPVVAPLAVAKLQQGVARGR